MRAAAICVEMVARDRAVREANHDAADARRANTEGTSHKSALSRFGRRQCARRVRIALR